MRDEPRHLVEADLRRAVMGRQTQVDVGGERVGLMSVLGAVGVVDRQHAHAGVGQSTAHRGRGRGQPARLANGQTLTVQRGRGAPQSLTLAHECHRVGVAEATAVPIERIDGGGSADAIGPETGVALEVLDRPGGVAAQDPIDASGIEAEPSQPALELGDVLASEHRALQVEQPVAEVVPGLDQLSPGHGADDAVDVDAVTVLERGDGALGAVTERAVDRTGIAAQCSEAGLQIADVVAPCAGAEGADYRNSPSSCRSWPLPLAPTMRFAGSPFSKTMSVGMLMTW